MIANDLSGVGWHVYKTCLSKLNVGRISLDGSIRVPIASVTNQLAVPNTKVEQAVSAGWKDGYD